MPELFLSLARVIMVIATKMTRPMKITSLVFFGRSEKSLIEKRSSFRGTGQKSKGIKRDQKSRRVERKQ